MRQAKAAAAEDSDDDSLFDQDDDDSDEDSEDDDGRGELKGRARWLKKVVTAKTPEDEAKEREKKRLRAEKALEKKKAKMEEQAGLAKRSAAWQVEVENVTEEVLDRRIAELVASRGRKNTDPREVLRKLEVLSKAARPLGPRKEIPVLMHLISAMFDSQRVIDDYMDLQQWRTCYRSLLRVTSLLHDNEALVLGVIPSEDVADILLSSQISKDFLKKQDEEEEVEKPDDKTGPIKIVGSLETFLVRLEDEYTKSLQQINPHTQVSPFFLLTPRCMRYHCMHAHPTTSSERQRRTPFCALPHPSFSRSWRNSVPPVSVNPVVRCASKRVACSAMGLS